jgi:hypothetical protein
MRKKWVWYCLSLLTVFGIWSSCNRIVGTYITNHGINGDTLKIFPNHTYVRSCHIIDDEKHYSDTGTWEVANGTIAFRRWYNRNPQTEHFFSDDDVIWAAEIDRAFWIGRIRLLIDYDMEYYYVKQ